MPEQPAGEVLVTLNEAVRYVAREAAELVIKEHVSGCEARRDVLPHDGQEGLLGRVRTLETKVVIPTFWRTVLGSVVASLITASIVSITIWLFYLRDLHAFVAP